MRTLAILFILSAICFSAKAECGAYYEPPCGAYWHRDFVFTGRVISVAYSPTFKREGDTEKLDWRKRITRVAVEESFRGASGAAEIEIIAYEAVRTPAALPDGRQVYKYRFDSDCTEQFREGERYLIYAGKNPKTGELYVPFNRTRPLAEADEDLAYIRSVSGLAPGAMIFGTIRKLDRDLNDGNYTERTPVANAKIIVDGEGKTYKAVSDDAGQYKITGLPAGKYEVSAKASAPFVIPERAQETQVVEKGCAQVDFYAHTDGRISGKLLKANGEPLAKTKVDLVLANPKDGRRAQSLWAYTDEEGRFEFKEVPPGKYRLGGRLSQISDDDFPYPRFYYPGVSEPDDSTVMEVGAGAHLENYILQLPPALAERKIEGAACGTTILRQSARWSLGRRLSISMKRWDARRRLMKTDASRLKVSRNFVTD